MKNLIKVVIICTISGLLISRISLLAHEFLGHGSAALLDGTSISGYFLYFFGGGFIQYSPHETSLTNALLSFTAGWIVQLILGGICLILAQMKWVNNTARFFLYSTALLNIVHAFFYTANSIYYGYGDGYIIYKYLYQYRLPLVISASIAMTISCFMISRMWSRTFLTWFTGSKIHQTFSIVLCISVACIIHYALYELEYRYFPNDTYAYMSTSESTRKIEEELALYNLMSKVEIDEKRQALINKHQEFPITPLLIGAIFASSLAGITQQPKKSELTVSPRWSEIFLLFSILLFILFLIAYLMSIAPIVQ
jgi:hypothetical protein